MQSPSCCNEHVDFINKQRPPPLFWAKGRSVVCHKGIKQVDSTHLAIIVVYNSRLRNLNYCFAGHTPSLDFSNCFHRIIVSGNGYTLIIMALDSSNNAVTLAVMCTPNSFLHKLCVFQRALFESILSDSPSSFNFQRFQVSQQIIWCEEIVEKKLRDTQDVKELTAGRWLPYVQGHVWLDQHHCRLQCFQCFFHSIPWTCMDNPSLTLTPTACIRNGLVLIEWTF